MTSDEEGVGLGPGLPNGERAAHTALHAIPDGRSWSSRLHAWPMQRRLCDYLPCFKSEDVEAQKA